MKNSKLNTIIIVIVTAIVLFFALKDDFIEKINYLFSFNILWLIFAIILVVSYWILKSLVIYYCTKKFNNQYKFKQSLKLIMDVQFVNGITPFATGGQPYQVYRLKKQGLNLRQSTNVAIQDFIVYQIALITLGTIAIITNYFLGIFVSVINILSEVKRLLKKNKTHP